MKNSYLFVLILMVLCFADNATAQTKPFCATPSKSAQERAKMNSLRKTILQIKAANAQSKLKLKSPKTFSAPVNGVYFIPVVFHIAHTGQAQGTLGNPNDAQIATYLDVLNQGFSNTYDHGQGFNSVDTKIQFVLAKRDLSCSASTGIYRYDLSSNTAYATNGVGTGGITRDELLIQTAYFDPISYYNIYIINKIDGSDNNFTGSATSDNMILLSKTVNAGYSSQTIVHEMGHSFNLDHIFEGSNGTTCPLNDNCAVEGDKICDTEPILESNCLPTGNNPCTGLPFAGGQFNHMGYYCNMDRFTQGQVSVMQASLETEHASYKSSNGGLPLGANTSPKIVAVPGFDPAEVGNNLYYGPTYVEFNNLAIASGYRSSETPDKKHYIDHSCTQVANVVAGATYPLSIMATTNEHAVKVYIDYNNDGVIADSTTEMVMATSTNTSVAAGGERIYTANIVIPTTGVALNTPLRMRVIADRSASGPITIDGVIKRGQIEDYTIVISGVLPVEMNNAKANLLNNMLSVNWTTLSERNVDGFEIQLSENGIDFRTVGTVKTKSVDGNSNASLNYDFSYNLNNLNTLFVSFLSLAGVLLFTIRKRKKYMLICATIVVFLAGFYGCRKAKSPEAKGESVYVKLVQLDRDGTKSTVFTTIVQKK